MKKNSFVMYTSYINQIKKLSLEEKGELLEAIFDYQLDGEVDRELSPLVDMVFSFMQMQFDMDREKYEEKCAILNKNKKKPSKKSICSENDVIRTDNSNIRTDNSNIRTDKCDIGEFFSDIGSDNEYEYDNDNEYDNENEYVYDNDTLSNECVVSCACGGESEGERAEKEKEEFYLSEGFEGFWRKYPRRQGRYDALSAWKKIKPDEALRESIMKGLEKAIGREEWLREGGRYVPMASTWLEGRRWEDEDISCSEPPIGRSEWGNKGYSREYGSSFSEWNENVREPTYGDPEEFFELALRKSYERMNHGSG